MLKSVTLALAIACATPIFSSEQIIMDGYPNIYHTPHIEYYDFPRQLHQVSTYCIFAFDALKRTNPRVSQAYCDYWNSIILMTHTHIIDQTDPDKSPADYWRLIQK